MAAYDYDMIVIGAGAGGLSVSSGAGQLGLKTLLIERENKLGGDCLHYGCVPSKTLIRSAGCYHLLKNTTKYGLPEVSVPQVDLKSVLKRVQDVIDTIQEHDSPEEMKKYNVETRFGKPEFINSHTVELNGQRISSKVFVIATGSSPFIPPVEGLKETPFITNLDIFSLETLPGSMIVLGGGPIAMEMAQAFSRFGSTVTVVELMDHILPREDDDVAGLIKETFRDEGIKVYDKTKAVKVKKEKGLIIVTVDGKEGIRDLEAQTLLVATGRKPNVEGLGLKRAGVNYSAKGIPVDKRLRTSVKHIYGCGDVINGYQFTHVAAFEAGIVISNAVLHLPFKTDYTNVPWCTFLDPEVASIGLNESGARRKGLKFSVHKAEFHGNDRALAEGKTKGFIKLILNTKGKVIGVQIVGPHAGELIHEWVAVLNGKLSLSTIAQAIHVYPTLAEISKKVSGDYFAPSLFNKKTRNILRFLFRFKGNS